MKVQELEKWPYYFSKIMGKDENTIQDYSIQDPRLIQRLSMVFPNLQYLLDIPINSTSKGGYQIDDQKMLVSAEYFPLWMFCPNCGLFMKFFDWLEYHRKLRIKREFRMFCPECNLKKRNVLLEQVRFIQVSKQGDIRDIDWDAWFEGNRFPKTECSQHKLKYTNAIDIDNLNSIRIACAKCKSVATLKGIFSEDNNEHGYITVLKTSSSVYFPQIVKSLIIPCDNKSSSLKLTEFDYRCKELDFMRSDSADDVYDELPISLKKMDPICELISLISIRSLSIAAALCSYSRVEPVFPGVVFQSGRSKHVTQENQNTKYLPCIKLGGEGFLLDFSEGMLRDYYTSLKQNERFIARIDKHKYALQSFNPFGDNMPTSYLLYKYVLLHSLSHVLIKQMEAVCGYSAASISERIYCSEDTHAGIMIYTVSGTEGSFGGIVSLVERGDLPQLLIEALEKSRFCTNDPVCLNESSVCFSCSFLPESSCESFNMLLDRSLLIDNEYGISNLCVDLK